MKKKFQWEDLPEDIRKEIDRINQMLDKSISEQRKLVDKGEELYNEMPDIPEKVKLLEDLAEMTYSANLWEKAIKYNKLLQTKSNYTPEYLIEERIADSYRKLGKYKKAVLHYSHAIQISDYDEHLYYKRANCYFKLGNYKKGFEDLNEFMDNCRDNDDFEYGLDLLDELPVNVILILKKLIKENPNNPNYYLMSAYLQDEFEEYDNAIRNFIQAIKLDYTKLDYLFLLVYRYYMWEMYDVSLFYYENLLKSEFIKEEDKKFCASKIGLIKFKLEQYDEAIKYFDQSVEEYPLGYAYRAICYKKLGDDSNLFEDLVKASAKIYLSEFSDSHSEPPFYLQEVGKIILNESIEKMMGILIALFDFKKELNKDDILQDFIEFCVEVEIKNKKNFEKDNNKLISIFKFYPGTYKSIFEAKISDPKPLFDLSAKLCVLKYISENYINVISIDNNRIIYPKKSTKNKNINNVPVSSFIKMRNLFFLQNLIHEKIIELKSKQYIEIELLKEKEISRAQIEERNKVIADLSHSIKNLISSVIDPLQNMAVTSDQTPLINNALRGANLIRQVVNAMNLSYKGSIDDFIFDAKNAKEADVDLKQILSNALIYSVNNIFDGKYFNQFNRAYFPTKDRFLAAKKAWESTPKSDNIERVTDFISNYLTPIGINWEIEELLRIGDKRGSSVKLLILFQEIVFNALKYNGLVSPGERGVEIACKLIDKGNKIKFQVINSFDPDATIKTSGLGHIIISNFAKLLNTDIKVKKTKNKYSLSFSFPNLWR